MSEAPERIWWNVAPLPYSYTSTVQFAGGVEYVRADRIEELEAKLVKAVEALEFYATLIGEKHECPWHMLSDDYGEIARTTLAELEGEK